MRISQKHIGHMVRVKTPDAEQLPNHYSDRPFAIHTSNQNWFDSIDGEFAPTGVYDHSFIPVGTIGLLISQGEISKNVTVNYGKVLFPETIFKVSHESFPGYILQYYEQKNIAGSYWISGDFLEIVETP